MADPATRAPFQLRLRRGFLVRCTPVATGRPLVIVGLHLKSLRGNEFSHYKRMAQARIVRAALQVGAPYPSGPLPSPTMSPLAPSGADGPRSRRLTYETTSSSAATSTAPR